MKKPIPMIEEEYRKFSNILRDLQAKEKAKVKAGVADII